MSRFFRMTGCPNGCGRPETPTSALLVVHRTRYAMFVGGSVRGDRLAGLEFKSVLGDDIPGKVREFLQAFKDERKEGRYLR